MGAPEKRISDLVDVVKSWVSRRGEPASLSRDFWMPDQSCRVCYECDSQFTVFNRRHHCRLCGRVFCAKCTDNSIPAPSSSDEPPRARQHEDWERIRVCNYCFKQWEQGSASLDNGSVVNVNNLASPGISPSPSQTSLVSTQSSCSFNSSGSTVGSTTPYSTGPYQRVQYTSGAGPWQASQVEQSATEQESLRTGGNFEPVATALFSPGSQLGVRSDEDDDYGICGSLPDTRLFSHSYGCDGPFNIDEYAHMYGPQLQNDGDYTDTNSLSCSPSAKNHSMQNLDVSKNAREEGHEHRHPDHGVPLPSGAVEMADYEPVDFENSGLLWLPPEPEDSEDEREALLCDDNDEDDGEGSTGEWGYLRSTDNFGSEEYRVRDKAGEEHRKAMKNVVEGHFRALVSQLLQVDNLPVADEDGREGWLEIVTSLSWEAASLLTPDTSKGGGMDPGGYVKVKCVACGRRSESMVIKGVVCKKNVAHRRMISKIDKPRLLILGGALEYHRVTNLLSSVDTLLQQFQGLRSKGFARKKRLFFLTHLTFIQVVQAYQFNRSSLFQEMDHLKMAVAKIDAHHPNVLLVEKSVSRYAQEYLLAKNISLALNIKKPLLERIARCTGAQIVPTIDHLTPQKMGCCDIFHVERYFEEHGSAGQGGKKLTKTLMYFEGCPKPFGCTILLKGANGDELKKVKHVVQYGVFAAYHLALETSFLADEGASLPELPLNSPITVALPDKPSSFDKSISTIPGFNSPVSGRPLGSQFVDNMLGLEKGTGEIDKFGRLVVPHVASSVINHVPSTTTSSAGLSSDPSSGTVYRKSTLSLEPTRSVTGMPTSLELSGPLNGLNCASGNENTGEFMETHRDKKSDFEKVGFYRRSDSNCFATSVLLAEGMSSNHSTMIMGHNLAQESYASRHDNDNHNEKLAPLKEEFPPSPSDHQSILVSLSTRCVWKGTVCERAHLLRIKYYGSFDKPLGRFLRDHLFDQNSHCHSCEMPSEAHVHCYTHRQGSLTISVKKLPEFLLPGERDGKIWMWHRCLRCPRTNGFPPATRRIVMSDAAWGLSLGKFLELSFSNHAAASRVASCGHSLHRDCLRFYGFGKMVACFRYAPINVHSVHLPPSKVEFNHDNQDWIQKEADEVGHWAELLFTEVQSALQQIPEKVYGSSLKNHEVNTSEAFKVCISELKAILQKEREEFQESLSKITSPDQKIGQQPIDIFEINKLRRQILFHSYIWDQRLVYASGLSKRNSEGGQKISVPKPKEKRVNVVEKLIEMDMGSKPGESFNSFDSYLSEMMPYVNLNQGQVVPNDQTFGIDKARGMDLDKCLQRETDCPLSSSDNLNEKTDPLVFAKVVRRVHSEGEFRSRETLSETLDAAWIGKSNPLPKENRCSDMDSTPVNAIVGNVYKERSGVDKESATLASTAAMRRPLTVYNFKSGLRMPFPYSYGLFKSSPMTSPKLDINAYNPAYISLSRELERQSGARLLLPAGINDTIAPVYDDEPTSIIAYALTSSDYHAQMSDNEKPGDSASSPLVESANLFSVNSLEYSASNGHRSFGSIDESILSLSGSRGSQILDPLLYTDGLHARVSFSNDGPLGKVKYTITCYCAKRFEALRRICCPSELDFIRSLSRCKKWGAQGGKSNVFFAKTLDDRFVIKQVTKTELESFIKFGPAYFKYLSESISTGSPTCLAKILGIYQVVSKHVKGGKETKMDVLVMENLLFKRSITRLYDLKGSSRSRYNPDTNGSNKVLLDQNLIEAMPTSPIFVGSKAKRLLERAVWNDTAFLASIDVMDYSLLVGMDEEKHELVLGIIDFMRQYTWDKHLETWVKTSGILGGSKNATPTVISPQQYKKRFRKAMTTYFLMVPDQWSPTTTIQTGGPHSDMGEGSCQNGTSYD